MQPYIKDYLKNPTTRGEKTDTKKMFKSQASFNEEHERIFREVDEE